jgi:hypothetical protein
VSAVEQLDKVMELLERDLYNIPIFFNH